MSVLSERPKDCWSCKLISGFGLIGCGMYVLNNARRFSGYHKGFMAIMASCLSFCGTARLLDYQVFPVKENKADGK